MIKVKSRSNEQHITSDTPSKYFLARKDALEAKSCGLRGRNYSNQYIPRLEHFTQSKTKYRNCVSGKSRKHDKGSEGENGQRGNSVSDSRKHCKTFIGTKLKNRLQNYLLFIALVNYSLRKGYRTQSLRKYKIFVGKGNNSKLVKRQFHNRFWWTVTNDISQANLVWTQKSNEVILESLKSPSEAKKEPNHSIVEPKQKHLKRETYRKQNQQQFQAILAEQDRKLVKRNCRQQCFVQDLKVWCRSHRYEKVGSVKLTHNHILNHRKLTNKKNLFHCLQSYCQQEGKDLHSIIPLTFHFDMKTLDDKLSTNMEGSPKQIPSPRHNRTPDLHQLTDYESQLSKKERHKLLWIVKPGQNSNRGSGISVCKGSEQVLACISKEQDKHSSRTFIVQKYIYPFLFHRRKFDIRCFVLVTATPQVTAYYYPEGYIRTSSFQFNPKNLTNRLIHLTNDAVQKKNNSYSKYEEGNKIRFEEFQVYLDNFEPARQLSFRKMIVPRMKELAELSIRSARNFGGTHSEHTFQILGYDFMIDEQFQPWLIEINTNPCLEISCDVLREIIPSMLENSLKIAVDPVFKPPKIDEWPLNELFTCSDALLQPNKFQLIYSELHDSVCDFRSRSK